MKLADIVYAETGIDSRELDQATEFLKLEETEEYKAETGIYMAGLQEI